MRLAALGLLLPTFAFAATQAGFPSQALWISAASPIEGETVIISTVVVNDTPSTLAGSVVFLGNDAQIGVREFELPSGKSQIHSIEWKPKRGEYRLIARIEGTAASLSQKETPPISITVKEPPAPPSEIQKTISQIAQTGVAVASSSAPVVIHAAQNVYAQTEALRNAGINRLEKYVASREAAPRGLIAGTSTNTAGFDAPAKKSESALSSLAQTAAAGGLFILKNSALFYPLLVFVILGALYALAKKIRRRSELD